jgi:hypothetical protein
VGREGGKRESVLCILLIYLYSMQSKTSKCTYFAARAFLRARLGSGMNAASARLHDEDLGMGCMYSWEIFYDFWYENFQI